MESCGPGGKSAAVVVVRRAMKVKLLTLALPSVLLALPGRGHADPLVGKSLAGGAKLPKAFGVGIDYFGMDQP